jgi:hypothetical protein
VKRELMLLSFERLQRLNHGMWRHKPGLREMIARDMRTLVLKIYTLIKAAITTMPIMPGGLLYSARIEEQGDC